MAFGARQVAIPDIAPEICDCLSAVIEIGFHRITHGMGHLASSTDGKGFGIGGLIGEHDLDVLLADRCPGQEHVLEMADCRTIQHAKGTYLDLRKVRVNA